MPAMAWSPMAIFGEGARCVGNRQTRRLQLSVYGIITSIAFLSDHSLAGSRSITPNLLLLRGL